MLHAMIMAGGSGTRFWPASRHATPKQLLQPGGRSDDDPGHLAPLGRSCSGHRVLVRDQPAAGRAVAKQLPELPAASIIGEPCRRDTAPAIGLAAAIIARRDPDATMVVMPADHVIHPAAVFQQRDHAGRPTRRSRPPAIVTFGIRPSYPAESFGYIERGDALPHVAGAPVFQVQAFARNRPPTSRASMSSRDATTGTPGSSSGRRNHPRRALRRFEPEMFAHLQAIADSLGTDHFTATLAREFAAIVGKSIDYAVMEHYDNVVVIEAPFEWDDLGSWRALARLHGADANGNTRVGRNLVVRTTNSIIRSTPDHLVATIGVDNIIIVHTPDATLVVNQDDEEAVREIVKLIQEEGWDQYL